SQFQQQGVDPVEDPAHFHQYHGIEFFQGLAQFIVFKGGRDNGNTVAGDAERDAGGSGRCIDAGDAGDYFYGNVAPFFLDDPVDVEKGRVEAGITDRDEGDILSPIDSGDDLYRGLFPRGFELRPLLQHRENPGDDFLPGAVKKVFNYRQGVAGGFCSSRGCANHLRVADYSLSLAGKQFRVAGANADGVDDSHDQRSFEAEMI